MDSEELRPFPVQEASLKFFHDLDDDALARWADRLYCACDAHKLGAPYVVRLAAGTNKKTTEALRSRGFIVLYPGEYLDKLPW